MSRQGWSDAHGPGVRRSPVRCIKCGDTHVVLTKTKEPSDGPLRWRYTCLDCRVAWWVDEHGGTSEDYA
ncbi:hypothetical protein [Streptomyces tsukubensis]|uniref:Uncharacterized protein n=1 Tax=Streptomyces tsukubensis TaxID=83656 RepID=A0A1V4A2W2_9ACTN|nr:hypothetical protein [Streptomyces tsukubensis]OON73981.1 hypothetical protein B1H18_26020 [Streptomyces tsukubensis]QFR92973.1 hypothetical protein GBW32_07685 [Streptomyces tsukubensis]